MESKQMNSEVMANEASAVGTEIAAPTTAPATLERIQELWESTFTRSASETLQPPFMKRARFTPKLSSVTVAPNRQARRFDAASQNCESDAPYKVCLELTSDTLSTMAPMGLPASHMFGIMYCPAPE